jgi:tetratricopeptide (TPR) repeat protein
MTSFIFAILMAVPPLIPTTPELLRDNHYNELKLPAGSIEDARRFFIDTDAKAAPIVVQASAPSASSLWAASFFTYQMTASEQTAEHGAAAQKWMECSALSYLNPLALSLLAKMEYRGMAEGGIRISKNLGNAHLHSATAQAIAQVCQEQGGDTGKAILDRVTAATLGITDGLHTLTAAGNYDDVGMAKKLAPIIADNVDQFCLLHGLKRSLPLNEQALYGTGPKSAYLQALDREFIAKVTQKAGTREKAAEHMLKRGWEALDQQKEPLAAIRCFNQAYLLAPENSECYWGLGIALGQSRRVTEALATFKLCLTKMPNNARLHGDVARAEINFAASAAHSPSVTKLHLAKACDLCAKGIAINPSEGSIQGNLALANFMQDDYAAAWKAVHAAEAAARPEKINPGLVEELKRRMPEPKKGWSF